jgi:hypothetical protein
MTMVQQTLYILCRLFYAAIVVLMVMVPDLPKHTGPAPILTVAAIFLILDLFSTGALALVSTYCLRIARRIAHGIGFVARVIWQSHDEILLMGVLVTMILTLVIVVFGEN